MLKVGSTGSTPDSVTIIKPNKLNQGSVAKQELLNIIGESVFNLNTIVVGLAAVENGAEKPAELDISWDPIDRKVAARKSRKSAIHAAMIQAVEAINQYCYAVASLPRFKSLRAEWKKNDTSMAERFIELTKELGAEFDTFEVYGVALMIHWRNRFVHSASSANLQHHEKKILRDNEAEISAKYSGLSVDCLLCHFQEMRPTLKDVSSLIAMTINMVRKIDMVIYECNSKEDVEAWLNHYEIDVILNRVIKHTKAEKINDSIKRTLLSNAPQLLEPYLKFCLPINDI